MGYENWFNLVLFFSISCFLVKFVIFKNSSRSKHLPPGPRALPVTGHLHLLKQPIHRTLDRLSQKCSPIILLQFGTRKVVVIYCADAVEECFTKNDIIFANRPQLLAGKLLNYNFRTIGFSPCGGYWLGLRRLATLELLSINGLPMLRSTRQEEVHILVKQLYEKCSDQNQVKVELRSIFTELSFNIIMRMIAGKRYYWEDILNEEAREFPDIIREVLEIHGVSNLGDYLPAFRWVDIQGIKKRTLVLMKKMDNFFQKLVDERKKIRTETLDAANASGGSKRETANTD